MGWLYGYNIIEIDGDALLCCWLPDLSEPNDDVPKKLFKRPPFLKIQ